LKSKKIIMYLTPIIVIFSTYLIIKTFDYHTSNDLIYRCLQAKILSLSMESYFAFVEEKITRINIRQGGIILLIIFTDLIFILNVEHFQYLPNIPVAFVLLVLYSVLASAIFILILNFENYNNLVTKLFTNKIISFFGLISYGLYLYHLPILYYFKISHIQYEKEYHALPLLFVTLLIFIIPIMSYFFIEKPLLKFKKIIK
jgi:peptidoglycan/LPS O-acetylase OafA/YrhL